MRGNKPNGELVDRFVQFLNTRSLEPKAPHEIPAEMRGPAEEVMSDWYTWKILPSESNPWIGQIEERLPRRYPPTFHRLISAYRFCDLEVGPILFFANTGSPVFYELARRVFTDKFMSPFLLRNGYLQFGQAAVGDYDPICFAPPGLKDTNESHIVRLDHEEILIKERIKVTAVISSSIEDFMERTTRGEFEVH